VSEFLRRQDAYSRLHSAIQPFCAGKPEFYLVIDEGKFDVFSADAKEISYLIDERRRASPIRDHELLRHRSDTRDFVRLFTVAEAVEAVRVLVE
jgi:hypothetical protein